MKKRTGKMISLSLTVAMAVTAAPVTALAVDEPVQTTAQNAGETGTDTTTVDIKEEEEPATVVAAPVVDGAATLNGPVVNAQKITVNGTESDSLADAFKTANNTEGSDAVTIIIPAGEFKATADNQLRITRDNVVIEGAGSETIISDDGRYSCSGQGAITIQADDVTIKNLTVQSSVNVVVNGKDGNAAAIKIIGSGDDLHRNIKFENLNISSEYGHGLNIHGANGCTIDKVNITNAGKCGISISNSPDVTITNTKVGTNVWGDIGMMYANNNDYKNAVNLTYGEGNDIDYIYSERSTVDTPDTIQFDAEYSGTVSSLGAGLKTSGEYSPAVNYYAGDEDSFKGALKNASKGSVITLVGDITLSDTVTINKDITIDGKGHTISGKNITSTASRIDGFLVEDGTATFKNLTLTDFDEDLTAPYGSVIKIDNGDENAKVIAENVEISKFVREAFSFKAGTFEINNCKIDCAPDKNRPNVLTKGVQVGFNSGTYTVKGTIRNTEITNSASNYAKWDSAAIELFNNADVEIDGCTISQCTTGIHVDNYWVGSTSYPTYTGDVKASIKNTSITAEENAVRIYSREDQEDHKASVTIESGDFTGAVKIVDGTDEDSITISGGQFKESGDISDFIAPGSNLKPDGNGGFTVSKKSSGGSSHRYDGYITVINPKNGEVSVSDTLADEGDKITLTITPDKGYVVDKIEIVDLEGDKIDAKKVDDEDGKYTFRMENCDVTVTVTFKEEGKTTEDTDKEEDKDEETTETTELNFTDVKESDWFFKGVEYVVDKDIMSGVSENEFAPAGKLTRAMLVQMLYNMESRPACDAENAFMDVPVGQWYTDAVIWANDAKIVSGMGEGLFAPNMEITREQMVAMLYNYAKYKGYDVTASADLSKFADNASVSTWAQPAMQWAVAEGYISGMGDSQLAPQGTATRAEIASVIMRFMEATAETAE